MPTTTTSTQKDRPAIKRVLPAKSAITASSMEGQVTAFAAGRFLPQPGSEVARVGGCLVLWGVNQHSY